MKNKPRLYLVLLILLYTSDLLAQQIHAQFYSQLSLASGLETDALAHASDYAIWMAGKNYYDGQAFILSCSNTGIVKWCTEFIGTPDQDEISSLAPTTDGGCIFTFLHTENTGTMGFGKVDSNGNVIWFKSYSGSMSWYNNLCVIPYNHNYILAGSRIEDFGSDGSMNLLRIDEDGNILSVAAYNCAPHKVKKIFKDSQGNIRICGDYFANYVSHSFFAKTDSNFQSLSFHYYKGAVDQVHDAVINSSDEVVMSGLNWEDAIGEYWNAALLKVNNSGDVVWGSHFVSQDWLVSEFFGIERGTDPNSYFVIFEPEYFHGITNPFQTLGVLRFTEDGIADKVFYRNDSTYFYTMLERGKDSSYIEAFTNPNSSNGVIWKSDGLITSLHTNGQDCFKGLEYDYPLSVNGKLDWYEFIWTRK